MRGPGSYTSVEDALRLVQRKMRVRPSAEEVDVRLAFKRIIAEDVVAREDVPPRPVSHMDGYAVRGEDLARSNSRGWPRLRLRGGAKLGEAPRVALGRNQAFAVSTGSYIPAGADTVVPVEDVRARPGEIAVVRVPKAGDHVYPAGADLRMGTVVLPKGRTLRAQDVGMLMLLGLRQVMVHRRPKVALLATGNELTDSPTPKRGKVWNSHGAIFAHLLQEAGCEVVQLGVVPDDVERIAARLGKAVRKADVVLMIGGTSAGGHDLGEEALERLRPDALVHGLKMDRGRVAGCAVVGGKPVVMMPGPIQGGMNAFLLVGLPLIRRVSGGAGTVMKLTVRLRSGWEARRRFEGFVNVVYLKVTREKGVVVADPMVGETESMSLLTGSNAFAVVPEGVAALKAGEELEALLLPGLSSFG